MVFDPMSSLQRASKTAYDQVQTYLRSDNDKSSTVSSKRSRGIKQVGKSMEIISSALDKYSLDELALSFNGGKDCHVLLILILASLHERSLKLGSTEVFGDRSKLTTVYVRSENAFTEVDAFVEKCSKQYALATTTLSEPMKTAFGNFLHEHKNVKGIFVGIRRTDPYGEDLKYMQPTDHGWPSFTRIHPVLEWHYVEIWDFLRALDIEYCKLYDLGYTSLGGSDNTERNPMLKCENQEGFLPAYELQQDEEERLGRLKTRNI